MYSSHPISGITDGTDDTGRLSVCLMVVPHSLSPPFFSFCCGMILLNIYAHVLLLRQGGFIRAPPADEWTPAIAATHCQGHRITKVDKTYWEYQVRCIHR